MRLQVVKECELEQLGELAREIWMEYYPPIIGEAQTNYMLHEMYSLETLKKQMNEKKHSFFFWTKNDIPAGFGSLDLHSPDEAFLAKFYLKKSFRGKGEGALFLNSLEKTAILHKRHLLWLTVNRHNITAINFYFKQGFKISRCADFDIGNGFFMQDFVMKKTLIQETREKTDRI
jgi:GNAT superfamily N-acetyltransferase